MRLGVVVTALGMLGLAALGGVWLLIGEPDEPSTPRAPLRVAAPQRSSAGGGRALARVEPGRGRARRAGEGGRATLLDPERAGGTASRVTPGAGAAAGAPEILEGAALEAWMRQQENEQFAEERREQLDAFDQAYARLEEPDPAARMDALKDLADLDPVVGRRDLDDVLASAEPDDEVRWEAFNDRIYLAETDEERVGVIVGGLSDRSPEVREHAAYLGGLEDGGAHPQVVRALYQAFARESDSYVRDSIEGALVQIDDNFVPPWLAEQEAELEEASE